MPAMGDPNFAQTVALICDHTSKGALGLILNKPLPMRMGEIFEQLEIEIATGPLRERQVLRGGPMQTDRGFVVHRAGGEWQACTTDYFFGARRVSAICSKYSLIMRA